MKISTAERRVMILHRQRDAGRSVQGSVERAGYAVAGPYTSNAEAKRFLQDERPVAVILDVELTDGSTSDLGATLRRKGIGIVYQCDWGDLAKVPLELSEAAFLEHDADDEAVSRILADIACSAQVSRR